MVGLAGGHRSGRTLRSSYRCAQPVRQSGCLLSKQPSKALLVSSFELCLRHGDAEASHHSVVRAEDRGGDPNASSDLLPAGQCKAILLKLGDLPTQGGARWWGFTGAGRRPLLRQDQIDLIRRQVCKDRNSVRPQSTDNGVFMGNWYCSSWLDSTFSAKIILRETGR